MFGKKNIRKKAKKFLTYVGEIRIIYERKAPGVWPGARKLEMGRGWFPDRALHLMPGGSIPPRSIGIILLSAGFVNV